MAVPKKKTSKGKRNQRHAIWKGKAAIAAGKALSIGKSVLTGRAQGFVYPMNETSEKSRINLLQEPSLKASRIRAQVEPILILLIAKVIIDKLERLVNNNDLIDISINNNIEKAKMIVLKDLSNKKEIKLFVK